MSGKKAIQSLRGPSRGGAGRRQTGAVFVTVVVALVALLGFAALAVDVTNVVVARQELRNAADAGALAGARCLYNQNDPPQGCPNSGDLGDVNTNANQAAFDAATANASQKTAVDVNWSGGNVPDIERGHWSFGLGTLARGFYPNASIQPVSLIDVSTVELDQNQAFINAVRVTTRRQSPPVARFFSRIFGDAIPSIEPQVNAVAYVGFAGTLMPAEADQPIAICEDKLLQNNKYVCTVGQFVPSPDETGGWTSFEQVPNPGDGSEPNCGGGASTTDIRPKICAGGNPNPVGYGNFIKTNNGEIENILRDLTDCWTEATSRTQNWELTLPVVDCVGNNIAPCSELVGAVTVNVVWIQKGNPNDNPGTFDCATDEDLQDKNAPCQMDDWGGPGTDIYANPNNVERWNDFAQHFNLQVPGTDAEGNNISVPATYENGGWRQNALYFKPSCEEQDPSGITGGQNFGILAKIPKLVH